MAGMTLIELLVVLVIMGVLLAWAVPSFNTMIQSNRVASEANGFVGDLQFARAEAVKKGQFVSICPANAAGTGCASSTTAWQSGWIVFDDPNKNGIVDTSENLLRKQGKWKGTDTFVASSNAVITFSRDGFATGLTGDVKLTLKTEPENTSATRCVVVSLVGRQQVKVGACS